MTDPGQHLQLPTEQAAGQTRIDAWYQAITGAVDDQDGRLDLSINPGAGAARQPPEQRAACLRKRPRAPGRPQPIPFRQPPCHRSPVQSRPADAMDAHERTAVTAEVEVVVRPVQVRMP